MKTINKIYALLSILMLNSVFMPQQAWAQATGAFSTNDGWEVHVYEDNMFYTVVDNEEIQGAVLWSRNDKTYIVNGSARFPSIVSDDKHHHAETNYNVVSIQDILLSQPEITTLYIPGTVRYLDPLTSGASNLQEVIFEGSGSENVWVQTFKDKGWLPNDNQILKKISFGRPINHAIGHAPFANISSLEELVITEGCPKLVPSEEYHPFGGCHPRTIKKITIEDGKSPLELSRETFKVSHSDGDYIEIQDAYIGREINYGGIDNSPFKLMNGTVEFGEEVKTIGKYMFNWSYFYDLDLSGTNIVSIDDYAFDHCHYLKSLTLGNSLKTIGKNAFSNFVIMKSIIIGAEVESIGESAFYSEVDGPEEMEITYYGTKKLRNESELKTAVEKNPGSGVFHDQVLKNTVLHTVKDPIELGYPWDQFSKTTGIIQQSSGESAILNEDYYIDESGTTVIRKSLTLSGYFKDVSINYDVNYITLQDAYLQSLSVEGPITITLKGDNQIEQQSIESLTLLGDGTLYIDQPQIKENISLKANDFAAYKDKNRVEEYYTIKEIKDGIDNRKPVYFKYDPIGVIISGNINQNRKRYYDYTVRNGVIGEFKDNTSLKGECLKPINVNVPTILENFKLNNEHTSYPGIEVSENVTITLNGENSVHSTQNNIPALSATSSFEIVSNNYAGGSLLLVADRSEAIKITNGQTFVLGDRLRPVGNASLNETEYEDLKLVNTSDGYSTYVTVSNEQKCPVVLFRYEKGYLENAWRISDGQRADQTHGDYDIEDGVVVCKTDLEFRESLSKPIKCVDHNLKLNNVRISCSNIDRVVDLTNCQVTLVGDNWIINNSNGAALGGEGISFVGEAVSVGETASLTLGGDGDVACDAQIPFRCDDFQLLGSTEYQVSGNQEWLLAAFSNGYKTISGGQDCKSLYLYYDPVPKAEKEEMARITLQTDGAIAHRNVDYVIPKSGDGNYIQTLHDGLVFKGNRTRSIHTSYPITLSSAKWDVTSGPEDGVIRAGADISINLQGDNSISTGTGFPLYTESNCSSISLDGDGSLEIQNTNDSHSIMRVDNPGFNFTSKSGIQIKGAQNKSVEYKVIVFKKKNESQSYYSAVIIPTDGSEESYCHNAYASLLCYDIKKGNEIATEGTDYKKEDGSIILLSDGLELSKAGTIPIKATENATSVTLKNCTANVQSTTAPAFSSEAEDFTIKLPEYTSSIVQSAYTDALVTCGLTLELSGILNVKTTAQGKWAYRSSSPQPVSPKAFFKVSGSTTPGEAAKYKTVRYTQMPDGEYTYAIDGNPCTSLKFEDSPIIFRNHPESPNEYFATFYDSYNAYQLPDYITAYTGHFESGTEVDYFILKPIEGNILPKGEAVILKSTDDECYIKLTLADNDGECDPENGLSGVDWGTAQSKGSLYYMLSYGDQGFGFYPMPSQNICEANKAFLRLPNTSKARAFVIRFKDEDVSEAGIQELQPDSSAADVNVYTLSGQRAANLHQGIYIRGGKKVIIR